jgi:hypothetical protein
VAELFRLIEKHCEEISAKGSIQIRCGKQPGEYCCMTDGHVGLTVNWNRRYLNNLDGSSLIIHEYQGGLILPEELGQRMHMFPPQQLREIKYLPDLSLAREYVWKQNGETELLSSSTLADRCVIQFVELANRYDRGELHNRRFR